MVHPAISTPYPLPRQREEGADDKSPPNNFTQSDWSKERTPVAIIHDDVAPLALREFQLNDALLSQREIQIDEGGALAHPAEPEGYNMTTPIAGLTIYGDEQHWSATLEDDGDHAGNELLPCPICGSTDLELANTHTPSYWVACHNCGAEVPGDLPDGGGSVISSQQDCERLHRTAINSAVARWNTRSTGSKMTKPASFQRVLDELDAIGADTRPDLAPLINAIRAYGNAQYDPLWMGIDVAKGPDGTGLAITLRSPEDLEALKALVATPMTTQQTDDAAVEIFAAEMQRKLARSRGKGRGGWQSISADILSRELREHVDKGDPMDVATYAMFLWHNGQPISAQQQNGRDKADLTKDQHNAYNAVITFVTEDGYVDGLDFLRLWNEGDFAACRRDWPEAPEACYTGLETPYGSEREVRT